MPADEHNASRQTVSGFTIVSNALALSCSSHRGTFSAPLSPFCSRSDDAQTSINKLRSKHIQSTSAVTFFPCHYLLFRTFDILPLFSASPRIVYPASVNSPRTIVDCQIYERAAHEGKIKLQLRYIVHILTCLECFFFILSRDKLIHIRWAHLIKSAGYFLGIPWTRVYYVHEEISSPIKPDMLWVTPIAQESTTKSTSPLACHSRRFPRFAVRCWPKIDTLHCTHSAAATFSRKHCSSYGAHKQRKDYPSDLWNSDFATQAFFSQTRKTSSLPTFFIKQFVQ